MVSEIAINGFSSKDIGDLMKTEINIKVKGMHCKSCVALVEDGLSKLEGVKKTKVSLEDDSVKISFDSDKVSKEKIEGELIALGYPPKSSLSLPPKTNSLKEGIIYGLVPHIGCIGFIAASVLGVTVAIEFFKPLLMNPWFFHILILLALGFATLSSAFYLRKNGLFSLKGIKKKKKYLSAMYGSTVGINLILFFAVFPMAANFDIGSFADTAGDISLAGTGNQNSDNLFLTLQVDIPCPGHAPLISGELKTINGVTGVRYAGSNNFDVAFDSDKTSKEEILALDVFEVYPAKVIFESAGTSVRLEVKESVSLASANNTDNSAESCDGSCEGTGSCDQSSCSCSSG